MKMNITFKKRVLLSQYFVVFFFILFCLLIYLNVRDANDNKVHNVTEGFNQYRLASQARYDINQILQFLSGMSATKGENGLNDGFKKAEVAYKDLLLNLEALKKEGEHNKDLKLIAEVEEIIPLATDYYFTAVEMANVYIKEGTKSGNEFMETLNMTSDQLHEKTTLLFKESHENIVRDMKEIGQSTSLIKRFSVWGPLFILVVTSLFIFIFARKMDISLKEVVSGLIENSSDLEGASLSLYENSQQLFKTIDQQSGEMDLTSSAVHEISAMVDSNAEYSTKAKDATVKSVEVTQTGIETLEKVLLAIEKLAESNSHLVSDMVSFNKDVSSMINVISEIDNKTKVINEIVFQTKLLSFNASVEAARAGEHGKGFAVVAEEIGNLATMSGNAAKEITDMLTKSVATVSRIVNDSEIKIKHISQNAEEQVKSSRSVVNEAKEAMSRILENITVVEEMNKEIVVASKEQSTGVRDINHSLSNIAISIKNNHEVAQEFADQSKVLTGQAEKLSAVIDHFVHFIEGQKESVFDFKKSISSHIGWRNKLNQYMANPDGSLKVDEVCKDDKCSLGLWLYGEGLGYKEKHSHIYNPLVSSHADFHQCLGEIVELIDSGDKNQALEELRPKGKYNLSSRKTIELLKQLQKEIG